MPRPQSNVLYSQLPDREREICLRFRQVRVDAGMKQAPFAARLDIPLSRLKNYELARSPIRYKLASKLGEEFNINQRWLALGLPPRRPYFDIANETARLIPERLLFSMVYGQLLDSLLMEELKTLSEIEGVPIENLEQYIVMMPQVGLGASTRTLRRHVSEHHLAKHLRLTANRIPIELFEVLSSRLDEFLSRFEEQHSVEIQTFLAESKSNPLSEFEEDKIRLFVSKKLGISLEKLPLPITSQAIVKLPGGDSATVTKFPVGDGPPQTIEEQAKAALALKLTMEKVRSEGDEGEAQMLQKILTQHLKNGGLEVIARFKKLSTDHAEQNTLTRDTQTRISARDENCVSHMQTEKHFPTRLTKALNKAGLTVAAASEKWGINRRTIEGWKQGRSKPRGINLRFVEEALASIERKA